MKKQTAVEWLIEQIKEYDYADITDKENWIIKMPVWILTEKEEQAKAMEREQIVDAFIEAHEYEHGDEARAWFYNDAVKYYNETYKGGEQ